jgi:DtxR family Mn-dependent transcriptional regulator
VTENASSESVEMYLKTVAELGGERGPVPIGRVAERLGVSPVSANEMMKRLGEQQLIQHQMYKGVSLTGNGRRLANSVIRRQRLWECFLVDHLKLDWAKVHDLACDLEHATSSEVTEALAHYLGNPSRCPHGNPIPDPNGEIRPEDDLTLSRLKVGQSGRIRAIVPESSELLAYLAERGLLPGQSLTVIEAAPLKGPLTLQIGDSQEQSQVALGLALAELVQVDRVEGKKRLEEIEN